MSVAFDTIPDGLRLPGSYVEIRNRAAKVGLPATTDRVVLLGQMHGDGTATAATLYQVLDDGEAADLFGQGSVLHRMVLAALKTNRTMAGLYCVGLADDGGAVKATGTLQVAVSAQEAGTLKVRIGHDWLSVGVTTTDDEEDIAAALKAEIDLHPELPVTATVLTDTVTLTARNGGTLGNGIDLDWEYSTSGVTVTPTAMASGATDSDIQDALDVILQSNVTVIVSSWADATSLAALSDHLTARSDGVEQRGAIGVAAMDGTLSAATTIAAGLNDLRISLARLEGTATWAPELAAAYAAAIAGESDLARPLNGVTLDIVAPPDEADRDTRTEKETLLANGVTVLQVGPSEVVQIGRSITTRTTNDAGGVDRTFLDLQKIRVLDYVRRTVKAVIAAKFSRVKLAAVAHTETTTDPDKVRAVLLDTLLSLEAIDYLQRVDDLKDDVVVEQNDSDPSTLDIVLPADVVPGLHVTRIRIDPQE